jgi:chromosome segregation ATPase
MAYATVETVRHAVDALTAEGIRPSIPKIRSQLGGGSYTTIQRCLREICEEASSPVQCENTADTDAGSLPDKIRKGIAELGTAVTKLEETVRASLEQEIAEEHHRLRAAHAAEIHRLHETIAELRTQTDGASRDTQEICEELDRTHSELERARAEAERLSSERDELEISSAQVQEALQELQAERDSARGTAETSRAAADRAERELARVLDERQTAMAERDRANAALDELRQELRITIERAATAEARVASQDSELAACRAVQDQNRRETSDLQASLRQAEAARGSAEGQLAALRSAYTAEREAWDRERADLLSSLRAASKRPPRKASSDKHDT